MIDNISRGESNILFYRKVLICFLSLMFICFVPSVFVSYGQECNTSAGECVDRAKDLYGVGKLFEAKILLESALRRFPSYAPAKNLLDKLEVEILKRQITEKEVSAQYQKAKKYFLCGEYRKSIELFSDLLKKIPNHQYARRYLELAKAKLKDDSEGIENPISQIEQSGKGLGKGSKVSVDKTKDINDTDGTLDVSLLKARLKMALLSLRRQMADYLVSVDAINNQKDAIMEQLLREKQQYIEELEKRIKDQESLVNRLSAERLKLQGELLQIDQDILLLQERLGMIERFDNTSAKDVGKLYDGLQQKYRVLLERESELKKKLERELKLREELRKRLASINKSLKEEMQVVGSFERHIKSVEEQNKTQRKLELLPESKLSSRKAEEISSVKSREKLVDFNEKKLIGEQNDGNARQESLEGRKRSDNRQVLLPKREDNLPPEREFLIAEKELEREKLKKAREMYLLGRKALKNRDYPLAIDYFVKTIDIAPNSYGKKAKVLLRRARMLWEEAERKRMRLKQQELDQLKSFYCARDYYKNGDYKNALKQCNDLLAKYPSFSLAKELKELILLSIEEKKKSGRNLSELLIKDLELSHEMEMDGSSSEKTKLIAISSHNVEKYSGDSKQDKNKVSSEGEVSEEKGNFVSSLKERRQPGTKREEDKLGKIGKEEKTREGGGIGNKLVNLKKKLENAEEKTIVEELGQVEGAISRKDFDYAEKKLKRLVLLYPNRLELKDYLRRIEKQHRDKLFSDAVDELYSLIDKKEYLLLQGKLEQMQKDFPERRKEILAIKGELLRFLILPYMEEVEKLIEKGDIASLKEAKKVLSEVKKLFPRNPQVQRLYRDALAKIRYREDLIEREKAIHNRTLVLLEKEVKRLAKKFSDTIVNRNLMQKINIYQEKKRKQWYEKRLGTCKNLIEAGKITEAQNILKDLGELPKEYRKVVLQLKKSILEAEGEKNFATYLELAKAALKVYDFNLAKQYLDIAGKLVPKNSTSQLSEVYKDLQNRLRFYKVQQALKSARMRLEAGDFTGAKILVKDILKNVAPNNEDAKQMLKQIEKAEALYYANMKLKYGITALKQGDFETAVSLAKEGLKLNSRNSELWDLYRRARSAWLRETLRRKSLLREIEQEAAGKRRLESAKNIVKHTGIEYKYKKQLLTADVVAMLRQARRAFVEQNFDRVVALCERVLSYDVSNKDAKFLLDLVSLAKQEIARRKRMKNLNNKKDKVSKNAKVDKKASSVSLPESNNSKECIVSNENNVVNLKDKNIVQQQAKEMQLNDQSVLAVSNRVGSDSDKLESDVLLEDGKRAFYDGDYEKAIKLMKKVLSHTPNDKEAKVLLEKAMLCKQEEEKLEKASSVLLTKSGSKTKDQNKKTDCASKSKTKKRKTTSRSKKNDRGKYTESGGERRDVQFEENVRDKFIAAKMAYEDGILSTAKKLFEEVCALEKSEEQSIYSKYAEKYLWLISEREKDKNIALVQEEENDFKRAVLSKLYNDALELERNRKYEEAKAIYKSVLSLFPNERLAKTRLLAIESRLYKKEFSTLEEKLDKQEKDMLKQVVEEGVEKTRISVKKGDITKIKPQPIVEISPVKKKLQKKISAVFSDVPLVDILNFFAKQTDINIVISPKVTSAGYTASLNVKNMSLESALKYLLRSYGLTYQIDDNAIWITTPEELEKEPMDTKVYHLRRGIGLYTKFSPSSSGSVELGSGAKMSEICTLKDILEKAVDWPGGSKLVLDERTSSLIITNTPANLRRIDEILWNLDVVPVQVLIEAKFLEVDVTDLKELGVSWKVSGNGWAVNEKQGDFAHGVSGDSGFSFTDFSNGSSGLNLTYQGVLTKPQFEAVLHALYQSQNTRTLSSPRVTTLNNQTATIKVVDEWIYPTRYEFQIVQYDLNGDGDYDDAGETRYENVPSDFVKRDVGIILNVTPSVGDDLKTITLSLVPEVSDAVADYFEYTGGVKLPKFTSRNLSTNVVVDNTDTVVLGGLIRETRNKVVTKVPILGDIPVVGGLFRKLNNTVNRKNLLIFVTATIINPEGDAVVFDTQDT